MKAVTNRNVVQYLQIALIRLYNCHCRSNASVRGRSAADFERGGPANLGRKLAVAETEEERRGGGASARCDLIRFT